jgi:hypothetical protein
MSKRPGNLKVKSGVDSLSVTTEGPDATYVSVNGGLIVLTRADSVEAIGKHFLALAAWMRSANAAAAAIQDVQAMLDRFRDIARRQG